MKRLTLGLIFWSASIAGIVTARNAAGSEVLPDVALGSWTAEQFGSDVAILRSKESQRGSRPQRGGFFLSCSGSDRRLRVTFPQAISATNSAGTALLATVAAPTKSWSIVRFKLDDPATMLVTSMVPPSSDLALTIGHMLQTRPRGLDIVMSFGSGPILFTRLKVARLLLPLSPEDIGEATRFVDACGRYPATRAH